MVLFCFCSVSVCLRRKHDGKGLQKNCLRNVDHGFGEKGMKARELSLQS